MELSEFREQCAKQLADWKHWDMTEISAMLSQVRDGGHLTDEGIKEMVEADAFSFPNIFPLLLAEEKAIPGVTEAAITRWSPNGAWADQKKFPYRMLHEACARANEESSIKNEEEWAVGYFYFESTMFENEKQFNEQFLLPGLGRRTVEAGDNVEGGFPKIFAIMDINTFGRWPLSTFSTNDEKIAALNQIGDGDMDGIEAGSNLTVGGLPLWKPEWSDGEQFTLRVLQ